MGIKIKYSYLLLTVALGLASCGGESSSDKDTNEPATIAKGKMVVNDFDVNGTLRSYIIHIPQSYTGKEKLPLLLSFHGFKGNMQRSYHTAKLYEVAEKENFILVHPNGIAERWNAVNLSNNKDIDFVKILVDDLTKQYSIDTSRIYSTGMSNGGYFSIALACALSNKIAAVAPVSGTMFQNVYDTCQPSRPVPMLQIHGTSDRVVKYNTVARVLDFWIKQNGTDTVPVITNLPDIDKRDGSSVERHIYKNGINGSEVQHLKIIGGGHSWAGDTSGNNVNQDINASAEVWSFLKRFKLEKTN